jgi:LysR family nitrogen assimilation transcriptional regulator
MERLDVILALLNAPLEPAPAPEQTTGTITLALSSASVSILAPPVLEACRTRWPNVRLVIREGDSASLEEWLLNRRVDVAILHDPPTLDELDIEPVITERLGLVSGVRTAILDGSDPVRVRQLAG